MPHFYIWFKVCCKKKSRWTRICISHLVYSHIWLNLLPKEDCHFFSTSSYGWPPLWLQTKIPEKKTTTAQQLFFFSWWNSPKSEIINERLENQVILEVFNGQKWGDKNCKTYHISIFGLMCVRKIIIKRWIKICSWYLVYTHIWLNLPKEDHHLDYK